MRQGQEVVAHTFNPSTREAEVSGLLYHKSFVSQGIWSPHLASTGTRHTAQHSAVHLLTGTPPSPPSKQNTKKKTNNRFHFHELWSMIKSRERGTLNKELLFNRYRIFWWKEFTLAIQHNKYTQHYWREIQKWLSWEGSSGGRRLVQHAEVLGSTPSTG